MIGFDDAQSVGETSYGLIGEANRRRRSVWQTASAGALAVVVLFMLVMANSQDGANAWRAIIRLLCATAHFFREFRAHDALRGKRRGCRHTVRHEAVWSVRRRRLQHVEG